MRVTQPVIHEFQLGELIVPAHAAFSASMNGRPAIVRLDSAALFRLAPRLSEEALPELLYEKRDLIEFAAKRLVDDGFWTETDDGPEVLVTAIDF